MKTIQEIQKAINQFNNTNDECVVEDVPSFCNTLLVTIGNTEVAQIFINNNNEILNIDFKSEELGIDKKLNEKILTYNFGGFNGCEI